MVFPDLDPRAVELGGKQDHEDIARVLLDLGALVLMANVLKGQLVKLEGALEQRKV